MARTHLLLSILVVLVAATGEAETLFGPVVVQGGETYTGSFGMNCACTAYFVEARVNQGGKPREYTI